MEIFEKISKNFGNTVEKAGTNAFPFLKVKPECLFDLCKFLKEECGYNFLENMTGVDLGHDLGVVYQLLSLEKNVRICVKTFVERFRASLPSVIELWKAADCYEREIFEMFGIEFKGHPNLKPLLLPEGWSGHPLRKDYVYPETFNEIEHHRKPLRKEHPKP